MTIEEAINELVDYVAENDKLTISFETVTMARKALEKQIPKKATYEGDGYWYGQLVYDTWVCPNCGKGYEVDYEEYGHCPNCGQKIDWSEVEDC